MDKRKLTKEEREVLKQQRSEELAKLGQNRGLRSEGNKTYWSKYYDENLKKG